MSEVMRWKRFLPQMVLRVLVVEPDDSTRNVISALLRNCNYKVTSVSDGMEAWEALKQKPSSIDVVLTEVDLPSISGFTLLTLLMDHDVYKRIPVIMMSSEDCISTILKCMLKGAADFLIKPIRKNELKNIWQHLWRRQISYAENKCPSTGEESQQLGATSGKTALTSSSNAPISSEQEKVECKDTKIISKIQVDDPLDKRKTSNQLDGKCGQIDECGRNHEIGEFGLGNLDALGVFDDGVTVKRAKLNDSEGPEFPWEEKIGAFALTVRDVLFQESVPLGAIDLLSSVGAGKGESETSKSIDGRPNSACGAQLKLSLQRSSSSSTRRKEADGGFLLNHSSQSAFSRYNSGNGFGCSLQPYSLVRSKEQGNLNEPEDAHMSCRQSPSPLKSNGDNYTAVISRQAGVNNTSARTMELVIPSERSKNPNMVSECHDPALNAHSFPTLDQSTSSTSKTEKSVVIQESISRSSCLHKGICADNINAETPMDKHDRGSDSAMEHYLGAGALGSPMCARSTNSNENTLASKLAANYATCSSATAPGSKKDILICSGPNRVDTFHSSVREAALIKFRQKRKERCFEKKVRYHSRKQLAEKRPRVKGQFVRSQMQADSAS